MITMRLIAEKQVLEELNQNRFSGEICGYVALDTDGMLYLGHFLFSVQGSVTTVLESGVQDTSLVDGGVRACVAAGQSAGATSFAVNCEDALLKKWCSIFLKEETFPVNNEKIFSQCK